MPSSSSEPLPLPTVQLLAPPLIISTRLKFRKKFQNNTTISPQTTLPSRFFFLSQFGQLLLLLLVRCCNLKRV